MRAGRNGAADRVEMRLHGLGVGLWHDEGHAGVSAGTDGAEHVGVFVALILGLARSRAGLGPLVDKAILLANTHLVLEPHLDRCSRREPAHDLCDLRGKVFF